METMILLTLCVLPYLVISSPVTIQKPQLFQNTIQKWNINYDNLSPKDKRERRNRFDDCLESVLQTTTTNKPLEFLNEFCIMNDAEYSARVGAYQRAFNRTTSGLVEALDQLSQHYIQKKSRSKRSLPESYDYWENELGFVGVKDQLGCGSCWSFPVTASIEAIYKKMTGEEVTMSEQYWVDCGREGNGCAGGSVKQAYQMTELRQYMMSDTDWKYTAYYQKCKFTDDIIAMKNNAMKKMWFQRYIRLGSSESAALQGLQTSPVTFDSMVSNGLLKYSGGVFEDVSCKSDPNPHSMLLVGYTPETLRVRASYGVGWGDNGYANYKRGSSLLSACGFFSKLFTIKMTYRREMEYAFCNSGKLSTYMECKDSCTALNTADKSGWTLATIPTRRHNQEVFEMIQNSEYKEEKPDDKYNVFWMGLKDRQQDGNFEWADGFTPANYLNVTDSGSKFGLFVKKNGEWQTKSSLTYKCRGICSRAINCWDISDAVVGGEITFDKADLTEGTTATAKCTNGGTLTGTAKLKCIGGVWDAALPSCTGGKGATCSYKGEVLLDPAKQSYDEGEVVVVSCPQVKETRSAECTDTGKFVPDIPMTCADPNPDVVDSGVTVTLSIILLIMCLIGNGL